MFPKIQVAQTAWFTNGKPYFSKWMIWGCPYFRKPPYFACFFCVCVFFFGGKNPFFVEIPWNQVILGIAKKTNIKAACNHWLKEHDFFYKQFCKALIFGGCYPPCHLEKPLIFRVFPRCQFQDVQGEYHNFCMGKKGHPTCCCFTKDLLLARTLLATLQGGPLRSLGMECFHSFFMAENR